MTRTLDRRTFASGAALVCAGGLSLLTATPARAARRIRFHARATPDANRLKDGRPAAINIFLCALRGEAAFLSASFDTHYRSIVGGPGGEAVEGEILMRERIRVPPASYAIVELDIPEDAERLGVIAPFRLLKGTKWRDTRSMVRRGEVNIALDKGEVKFL